MIDGTSVITFEFLILAVACLLLLRHFASPGVTWDVKVTVFLSWLLGFAGILLLPFDISVALQPVQDTVSAKVALQRAWNFIYWSTFVLAWVLLPVQDAYHASGHFNPREKFAEALRKNLYFYLACVMAGIFYIVYVFATREGGSLAGVISFLMAIGNTYGVLLLTLFMGHGLVGLPVRLYNMNDCGSELERSYLQAGTVEQAYQESRYELEDCEIEVMRWSRALNSLSSSSTTQALSLSQCVSTLEQEVARFDFAYRSTSRGGIDRVSAGTGTGAGAAAAGTVASGGGSSPSDLLADPTDATLKSAKAALVSLHARLRMAQVNASVTRKRWQTLVAHCSRLEAVVSEEEEGCVPMPLGASVPVQAAGIGTSTSSDDSPLWAQWKEWTGSSSSSGSSSSNSSSSVGGGSGTFAVLSGAAAALLKTLGSCGSAGKLGLSSRTRGLVIRGVAVVCLIVSLVVLWSEMVMSSRLHSPVGLILGTYGDSNDRTDGGLTILAVSFLTLAYMSICCYWSLFRLNIFGVGYSMAGSQLSPPGALIFNAEYFSRLQFSLGYNFLCTLNAPALDRCAFHSLVKNIETIPVGGLSFTIYAPLVLVAVAAITALNGYGACLKLMGIEAEEGVSIAACCCGSSGPLDPEDQDRLSSGRRLVRAELRDAAHSSAPLHALHEGSSSTNPMLTRIEMPFLGQPARLHLHSLSATTTAATSSTSSSSSSASSAKSPAATKHAAHHQQQQQQHGRYADLDNTDHDIDDDDDEEQGRSASDIAARHRIGSWGLGDEEEEVDSGGGGRYRD